MIVTGLFYQVKDLQSKGYKCIDCSGTSKLDDGLIHIPKVKTTYWMYKTAKEWGDFKAARILYYNLLEEAGGLQEVLNFIYAQGEDIALIGYYRQDKFDYKFLIAKEILHDTGWLAEDYNKSGNFPINFEYQDELSKYNPYEQNGHNNLDHEFVASLLERHSWRFARTMPENPHYYTLRKNWSSHELFLQVVKHIRCTGKIEIFLGQVYYMFYYKKMKYWTMPEDLTNEDCDLINKAYIE